ncbi:hypothetical protein OG320_18160 [Microbispora sp. NBC_01189]|uniref:hypothetical protein n=1 Tax=Microbispora sp. NBC_01189 TaxID=2903583 RepID=UPI002E0E4C10|nr:hypothetical protein OG320_18160 [Microbispora sp. NBC_01189]
MRGKDSGSEHEHDTGWTRDEADADGSATTPATPPPSFGQTPPPGGGRAEPDEDPARASDATRAAGETDPWTPPAVPYPTRYGFQGGLRAQGGYDDDDDPENTNRFRAIPAYDAPPAEGGGAPAHGAHSAPPGPPGGQPVPPGPQPGPPGAQPPPPGGHAVPPGPLNQSGPPGAQYGPYGAHPLPPGTRPGPPAPQPGMPGMPGIQHVPPGPQPDAGALPAPRRPGDAEPGVGWVPRQPASGPDLPPAHQGGGTPSWQPPAQSGPPAWQSPAQGGPPAWQRVAHPGPVPPQQNPGATEWPPPQDARPPSSWQPPQEPQAPWWRQVGPDGTQAEAPRSDEPSPGVPSFAAWTPGPVEDRPAEDARWAPGDPGQPGAQSVPAQPAQADRPAEPARDVSGGAAPVPPPPPDAPAAPGTPVPARPGDLLPAPGEPGGAYGEAHASSAASTRPGEPGDVPVWPPRLPGEPDPQGEGRVGSSWPPSSVYRGAHASGDSSPAGAGGSGIGSGSGHDNDRSGARSGGSGPTGSSTVTGQPGIAGDQAGPSGEHSGVSDGPVDETAGNAASASGALPGDPGSGPAPYPQGAGDRPSSQDRDDVDGNDAHRDNAHRDDAHRGEAGRDETGWSPSSPHGALPPGAADAGAGAGAASGPYALPAGPPAGFGAEIGQAVTPIEGFPMPGGPYEPGQPVPYAGQHAAHHDQGGPYGGPPQEGTWPVPPPSPEGPYTTPSQQPPGQAPNHLPGQVPGQIPGQIPGLPPGYTPSGTSPGDAPPAAPDPGTAPYDAPPVSLSETDDAKRPASPDTDLGQMPTTSPATGSSTQPNGETPFAFTPVTPAKAGRPAPPPGFGPAPTAPGSALPATLGSTTPPPQGGKVKRILMAAGAVVVVGAIGTAAYFAYAGEPESGPRPRTSPAGAAPSSAAPRPSAAVASTILDTEQTDPRTLKPGEAFPDEKVTLDGRTYRRVKVDVTDDCGKAAAGAFATALTDQQCRRVLRATYVDGKRDYAVTAGIAVLPSKVAALAVDREKNLGANVWFRGLNGTRASGADKVTISGGYAAGMVWGRYIVFSYATYADGHTPDAKDTGLGPVSGAFRDHMTKVIQKRATR